VIDWKTIDARYFEKFIYHALGYEGFRNLLWFGRGGSDKGRDVVGTTYEELPFGLGYERKWVFQCKKWAKMPSPGTLFDEISKASQHVPDFWVLSIPLNATSDMIDYLSRLEHNFRFKIILMPLVAIEEIIHKYPQLVNVLKYGDLPFEEG